MDRRTNCLKIILFQIPNLECICTKRSQYHKLPTSTDLTFRAHKIRCRTDLSSRRKEWRDNYNFKCQSLHNRYMADREALGSRSTEAYIFADINFCQFHLSTDQIRLILHHMQQEEAINFLKVQSQEKDNLLYSGRIYDNLTEPSCISDLSVVKKL